jgi:GNAT superfamily N-acetyltransferase
VPQVEGFSRAGPAASPAGAASFAVTCLALSPAGPSFSTLLHHLGSAMARCALPPRRGPRTVTELRIDVMQPLVEGELEAIHERLYQPGSKLHGLERRPLHDPQFQLHWREADGEWFAYVEDMERRCLAGYTVFNRLVEVDRRTDRRVRSPHSRFAPAYQRRGIASAVYRSALDAGTCLRQATSCQTSPARPHNTDTATPDRYHTAPV